MHLIVGQGGSGMLCLCAELLYVYTTWFLTASSHMAYYTCTATVYSTGWNCLCAVSAIGTVNSMHDIQLLSMHFPLTADVESRPCAFQPQLRSHL